MLGLAPKVMNFTITSEFQDNLNKSLNRPNFDAATFTAMLELGIAEGFCKLSGSSDLRFGKATKKRPAMLRMTLAPNVAGVNTLDIFCRSEEDMDMKFYLLDELPGGPSIKSNVTLVEKVTAGYLLDVFEQVTGLYMGRTDEPDAGFELDEVP